MELACSQFPVPKVPNNDAFRKGKSNTTQSEDVIEAWKKSQSEMEKNSQCFFERLGGWSDEV